MNEREPHPLSKGAVLRRAGGFLCGASITISLIAELKTSYPVTDFLKIYAGSVVTATALTIWEHRANQVDTSPPAMTDIAETGQQGSDVVHSMSYAHIPDASPVNA